MRAKPEGAEILRSGNSLPRRAIALGYSRRPCAGSRKHRRPRSSMVENRSRRVPTPICVQRPRGPKSRGPVNACPVAPSLSATLADRAPARASTAGPVYRRSKIGPIDRPCKASVAGYPRSGKRPAPPRHRAPTLSQTDRGSRHTPTAASRWSKIGPIDRPRQHACKASVWPDTQGPANGPRRRAIALRHSRRLCAATGTQP